MTKNCPNCGKQLPDDAKFCMDCGHSFETVSKSSLDGIMKNGKIFIVIIAIVVILGLLVIAMTGNNDNSNVESTTDDADHVTLTITEVSGWDSSSGKKSYTLYTQALFSKVPDDMNGYLIKTTYFDKNGTQIGQETEKLNQVYYDSNYAISFGHYTTYKLPDPDHVTVEIIKDGKTVDNYTEKIDTNKIKYLN
ncbi:MAG: zinc ribbon domain-containing protein [Methanobrevibacter sp.]|uniref:zinc ribbon domain-containing protein n=1 Tax=Methanobrevibacter sp. TaxID=66852 RepID=UPI001B72C841|nr:zinc ribbon domain-containing protein [Methanobrevibacter sp.]MBP3792032.1 zinc ribbon domain-containing protein [Methanobrevibacter sp.]